MKVKVWSAWKNGERARREQSERKRQGETGERLGYTCTGRGREEG